MTLEQTGKKLLMTASVYRHICNFHLPYLREFQRLGWETHVGCAGITESAPYTDRAIELPFKKKMTSSDNCRAMRMLRQLIQKEHYDLIIAHTTLASVITRLAVKGMKGRPRLVSVMHGYLFDDDSPALRRSILLGAERLAAPQTDLLLVMNEWDFETARKYRLGKQIEKIPGMGVDCSRLDGAGREDGRQLRRELGISDDAFVLLCAAEFSGRKSQHVLIRAMAALPHEAVLVLCGDGAMLEECKALTQEMGVSERVLFAGQVQDMPVWYQMADACVTASRSEGLPFNVMEAMYLGRPVIASAVKGHTDLIEDGVNGLLYPYGSETAFAEQVCRLMEDGSLRTDLGQHAIRSAASLTLDRVLPEVMDRFLSVVE